MNIQTTGKTLLLLAAPIFLTFCSGKIVPPTSRTSYSLRTVKDGRFLLDVPTSPRRGVLNMKKPRDRSFSLATRSITLKSKVVPSICSNCSCHFLGEILLIKVFRGSCIRSRILRKPKESPSEVIRTAVSDSYSNSSTKRNCSRTSIIKRNLPLPSMAKRKNSFMLKPL